MLQTIITNWKTTGVAFLTALLGLLNLLFPKQFTPDLNISLLGILGTLAALFAKDGNVTGGTTINNPNDASVVDSATKTDVK